MQNVFGGIKWVCTEGMDWWFDMLFLVTAFNMKIYSLFLLGHIDCVSYT